ncbi:MAG: RNA polymerase sporulation sigma factor SigH [Oscillospiraceae bacterium]|nr:RNA polymerase sporulation sigma factor SigH [Oscillospiraceae bacterium]
MEQRDTKPGASSDEALCIQAAAGNRQAEEELVMRYTRLVRACARPFFLVGGDSEDLIQEGMLGLLSAVRSFQGERAVSFRSFAEVCIRRRLISAVRTACSGKHAPLNSYISFETPSFDRFAERTAPMVMGLQQRNPEDILISREQLQEYLNTVKGQLSGFEAKVLASFLTGASYQEIAAQVNRSPKSVDNAVQRIRRKLARQISSGEFSNS